jgi:PhnO protein
MKTELINVSENDVDYVFSLISLLENSQLDLEKFKELYKVNISDNTIEYYLILHDGKKCGFVSIYFHVLLHHMGVSAEIQELYIEELFRGKGIGKEVISFLYSVAKERNAVLLEVCTNKKRLGSQEFYKKMGFNESHYKYTLDI